MSDKDSFDARECLRAASWIVGRASLGLLALGICSMAAAGWGIGEAIVAVFPGWAILAALLIWCWRWASTVRYEVSDGLFVAMKGSRILRAIRGEEVRYFAMSVCLRFYLVDGTALSFHWIGEKTAAAMVHSLREHGFPDLEGVIKAD